MPVSRKGLCLVYGVIALLALAGTWGNNVHYLHLGWVGANVRFWQETMANPASRSITADLMFLVLALVVWMLLEARRLGMRGVWLYVVFGVLVAISVTFPVFLVQRERALAARDGTAPAGAMRPADVVGLAVLAVIAIGYAAASLYV